MATPGDRSPRFRPTAHVSAYLAPNEGDALQIWLCTLGQNDDRCVSAERRSIQIYEWAWDAKTILYRQDNEGDENFHLYAVLRPGTSAT